jgi:hypothetical protein
MEQASISTAMRGQVLNTKASRRSLKTLLADGARDWKLSSGMTAFISFGIPILICLAGAATALMGKVAYKMFTGEDGLSENLQVLFWTFALILGLVVMGRLWQKGSKIFAALYLLLNLGIIFIIGEEISWGQRIFGWETSEKLKAINKQEETNLHNIEGVGDKIKWLHVVIGAYGTIFPLLCMRFQDDARYREAISVLVPHYTLVPHFFATLVWRLQANLWKPPKSLYFVITEYSEVMELVLAVAFFTFLLFQFRSLKSPVPQGGNVETLPLNSMERINRLLQQRSY